MLTVITINEAEKWDNVVKSFINYDVNYLSGYAKAFQLYGDGGDPILLYYDDGNTRAMNVIMKRNIAYSEPFLNKLPDQTWYDITTPYGYGGYWVEGENYQAINEANDNYYKEQGFVSEFVRFHLFSNYQPYFNGMSETLTHNVVRSLDISLEEILKDFEHKVRKNLNRATNSALSIEIDINGARINEFLDIYYGTMERTNADKKFFFTRQFFETLNEMEGNYVYIHVLSEERVISTELVLYGSENCYSFLGGTNSDYFHLRPNDFLKFEIIKWAKEKGLKRFVLGGGYGEDDGIYKYKKSFAPNGVYDFYIGKKIVNKEKYIKLLKLRKEDSKLTEDIAPDYMSGFFPKYRDNSNL